jgi:hypothetical protein
MAANGFNDNKSPSCTAVVALDISKAFDEVDHTLLIKQISAITLHPKLIHWLASYLRSRTASCLYQSAKSFLRIIHSGMPQGGVLSPDIYNFYASDFPEVATLTESYADDFEAAKSSSGIQTLSISDTLTDDLFHVSKWADDENLKIAPDKSSITLFTPDRSQSKCHPQAILNGVPIPLKKNPKILGVTFDTFLNFYIISRISVIASLVISRY